MGYTEFVERNITDAPLVFARDIRQMLTIEELTESVNDFETYKEKFRNGLEKIRSKFVFRVGYSLVKLIHEKYTFAEIPGDDAFVLYTVITGTDRQRRYPIKVHRDTILSPENLEKHLEDVDQYAKLLTKLALNRKRITSNQERTFSRKARILLEWKFDKDHTAEEARQKILEMAFYLGWTASDCDFLLLRTGLAPLCANSVVDQFVRFLLEVGKSPKYEIDGLMNLYEKKAAVAQQENIGYANVSTQVAYETLGDIIKLDLPYEEKLEAYLEKLVENQKIYDRHSDTARNCLEELLISAAGGLGWNVEAAPRPLTEEHQRVLMSAILSGATTDKQPLFKEGSNVSFSATLSFSNRFTYLSFTPDGGEYRRMRNLGNRFLDLLAGNERIKKNDILFAAFLDTVYNTPDPEDPVESYLLYKEACENLLEKCHLDRFYIPHALEYACAKSLLAGHRQQEAFFDVVLAYTPEEETRAVTSNIAEWKDLKKDPLSKKIPDEYEKFEKRLSKMLKDFPPFDNSITRKKIEIPEAQRFTEELWKELTVIAKELYSIWKGIDYHAIKLEIENGSNVAKITFSDEIIYLQHRLSDGLFAFLHHPDDKDHTFLSSLEIPALEGKKSLYELAKDVALSDATTKQIASILGNKDHGINDLAIFLERAPYLNRRLRRKTILWMISSIVLDFYGFKALELRAKNSAKNRWATHIPVQDRHRFMLPVANATAKCRLAFDFMDQNDVLVTLKIRHYRPPKPENYGEEQMINASAEVEKREEVAPEEVNNQAGFATPLAMEAEAAAIDTERDPLLNYLSTLPPELPDKETAVLAQRAANGDVAAQEKLVSHQSRLVYSIAREICDNADDILLLIDEGTRALYHLVETEMDRYNPSKKSFENFIKPTIRKAIQRKAKAIAKTQRKAALDSQSDSLFVYLESIAPFNTLPQEQVNLLAESAANGDSCAQEKLIYHNLKLVYILAKKRKRNGVDILELIGSGNEALAKRIKGSIGEYDSRKGTFSTFIAPTIIEAMRQAERKMAPIDIPKSLFYDKKKIEKFQMDYRAKNNNEMPSLEAIAAYMGKKPSTIEDILKNEVSVTSLDNPIAPDAEETLGQMILDHSSNFEARKIAEITEAELETDGQEVRRFITENRTLFTPRELEVIHLRNGLLTNDVPHTIKDVAELLKISPSDVLVTELNAYNKIRYRK